MVNVRAVRTVVGQFDDLLKLGRRRGASVAAPLAPRAPSPLARGAGAGLGLAGAGAGAYLYQRGRGAREAMQPIPFDRNGDGVPDGVSRPPGGGGLSLFDLGGEGGSALPWLVLGGVALALYANRRK